MYIFFLLIQFSQLSGVWLEQHHFFMDSLESIFSMQYVLTVTLSSCEIFCCTRFIFSYSIRAYVSFVPICHLMQCDNCRGFRLNCLFRFKIWWMIPSFGMAGCNVPIETQFLLLEARDESSIHDENSKTTSENTFYILFLPVLDGLFWTTLQGTSVNELEFCVESG